VSARREAQRRAAVAILAFVAVVAALGLGVYFIGQRTADPQHLDSVTTAERAIQQAQADLAQVFGPGIDLVRDDGQHLLAQLTQEEAEQLELERGQIVYVRPSRETVFSRSGEPPRSA
jgi:uncharacterized protein HemX